MISGYLSASFDLLDIEDLDVIDQALAQCERLTVGVFSDAAVQSLRGLDPVLGAAERAELVRHVRGVDDVVLHDGFPTAAPSGRLIVFTVADSAYPEAVPTAAVPLTPRRRTASLSLQRNAVGEAVA